MKIEVIRIPNGSLQSLGKRRKNILQERIWSRHAGDILYHGARNPLPVGYNTIP